MKNKLNKFLHNEVENKIANDTDNILQNTVAEKELTDEQLQNAINRYNESLKTEVVILLNTIDKVKEFIEIVSEHQYDCFEIDARNEHYVVDAKSIMGLFSLDLCKPLYISVRICNVKKSNYKLSTYPEIIKKDDSLQSEYEYVFTLNLRWHILQEFIKKFTFDVSKDNKDGDKQ